METEELTEGWAKTDRYQVNKHYFRENRGIMRSLCGHYVVIALHGLDPDDDVLRGKCPNCARLRAAEIKARDSAIVLGVGAAAL